MGIRQDLETELCIPENSLHLMNMTGAAVVHDALPDEQSLQSFGLKPGERIGIELRINYYEQQEAEEYVMPDMLEVQVKDAHGQEKPIAVHVQRPAIEKPYLGGFQHKETGTTYHHAVT